MKKRLFAVLLVGTTGLLVGLISKAATPLPQPTVYQKFIGDYRILNFESDRDCPTRMFLESSANIRDNADCMNHGGLVYGFSFEPGNPNPLGFVGGELCPTEGTRTGRTDSGFPWSTKVVLSERVIDRVDRRFEGWPKNVSILTHFELNENTLLEYRYRQKHDSFGFSGWEIRCQYYRLPEGAGQ